MDQNGFAHKKVCVHFKKCIKLTCRDYLNYRRYCSRHADQRLQPELTQVQALHRQWLTIELKLRHFD